MTWAPNSAYAAALTSTDLQTRNIAKFLQYIMNSTAITATQVDTLWDLLSLCGQSLLILKEAVKNGLPGEDTWPRFETIPTGGGVGNYGGTFIRVDPAKTLFKPGEVGNVAVTLAHELTHQWLSEGYYSLETLYTKANTPGMTIASFAIAAAWPEAEAWYVGNVMRKKVLAVTWLSSQDRPTAELLLPLAEPFPGQAEAIIDLQSRIAVSSPYRDEFDKLFIAASTGIPIQVFRAESEKMKIVYPLGNLDKIVFGWDFGNGIIVRSFERVDGELVERMGECTYAGGLVITSTSLKCQAVSAAAVADWVKSHPRENIALELGFGDFAPASGSSFATSIMDINAPVPAAFADAVMPTLDPSLRYFVIAEEVTKVHFGTGVFKASVSLAPSAVIEVDTGLANETLRLVKGASGAKLVGPAGQEFTLLTSASVELHLGDGTSFDLASFLSNAEITEALIGGTGSDALVASAATAFLGGKGNDTLVGAAGNDFYSMRSGDGNDTLTTGGGNDVLAMGGSAHFSRDGLDLLVTQDDGSASARVRDWFTPGTTDNMLATVLAGAATYDRAALTAAALRIEGSSAADTIFGVAGYSDVINGNAGDDIIDVSQNADGIFAGDVVRGGEGNDAIYGGDSNDNLSGDAGNDFINGGGGTDIINGGAGDDTIVKSSGGGLLLGGDGNDSIYSTGSNDTLSGGPGNDYLRGGGTNNLLDGGAGNDWLQLEGVRGTARGGAGNDVFYNTGVGSTMVGGTGTDTYHDDSGTGTIKWAEGDGRDFVVSAGVGTTVQLTSTKQVTATKSGSDLVVTSDTGGVTFSGWFDGSSRATLVMPDGSTWSPASIDSNFSNGSYSTTYSTGAIPLENALDVLLSYVPSLDGFGLPGNNRTTWESNAATLQSALNNSMYGEMHTDASGAIYYSWSCPFRTDVYTDGMQIATDHGTFNGGAYARATGSLQWDYWTDASGQSYIGVTYAGSSITTGLQWVEPPNADHDWQVGTTSNGWWNGPSAYSQREVTELEPRVDSFVLYQPGSVGARALQQSLSTDVSELAYGSEESDMGESDESAALLAGFGPSPEVLDAWSQAAARLGKSLDLQELMTQWTGGAAPTMRANSEQRIGIGHFVDAGPSASDAPSALDWLTRDLAADRTRVYATASKSSDFALMSI